MPFIPIVVAGIVMWAIAEGTSGNSGSVKQVSRPRSNINDAERAKRQYWYYRRKSGYRWK